MLKQIVQGGVRIEDLEVGAGQEARKGNFVGMYYSGGWWWSWSP